ncbi:MFS transporter [Rubritalea profundi]|uniref:MFS transporter n=1 Tax=Rubritalea profundi TaxID=1658618 RepID=A0A2S7U1R4_9BACT|nr:MFS transporter [Rubritalea profundi]PQJ28938.1 MFS transporter [Rubritalea profundi]
MSSTENKNNYSKLSIMMFLQFFAWGSWFATLKPALNAHDLGSIIGGAYGSAPLAAIFAPLFLGLVADRFFPSEKVMGVLLVIGGVIMSYIAIIAPEGASQGPLIVNLMIAYMFCYMPTLGLGNTITFTHLPQELFPKARVWGTIGWIVAGLVIGFVGWSISLNIFWLAAASTLLLGLFSFTLPHTPAPAKGQAVNIRSLLMFDAFKLLKDKSFAVFAICSTLICIPLAYYYGQTADFLTAAGYKESGSTMTIGQMSEIIFMLLIPFFFRKLGVKKMLLIGMGCWVARYALFAAGASNQIAWMLLLGVALHGICYDFFFVTGFIYTDKKAPKEVRGQAQSLIVFLTQGIGMFIGYAFAFGGGNWPFTKISLPALPNTFVQNGETYGTPPSAELVTSIAKIKEGEPSKNTLEQLADMFGKGYSDLVDTDLISSNMADWSNYWIFPAIMAAVIFVIFGLTFWDKVKTDDEPQD